MSGSKGGAPVAPPTPDLVERYAAIGMKPGTNPGVFRLLVGESALLACGTVVALLVSDETFVVDDDDPVSTCEWLIACAEANA